MRMGGFSSSPTMPSRCSTTAGMVNASIGEGSSLSASTSTSQALVAALPLAQLVRAFRAAEVLGHPRVAHQPLEQRQVAAAPGLENHRRAHSAQPSQSATDRHWSWWD